MRFQVPQYIEVEDKIFGPLTFKQFIYLAGSVGVVVVFYTLLPHFIAIILGLPILAFGAALAFYRINGKPFIFYVESSVKYFFGSKLYIWKKEDKVPVKSSVNRPETEAPQVYVPKLSESKLKDLSWSLDITQNQNPITRKDSDNM